MFENPVNNGINKLTLRFLINTYLAMLASPLLSGQGSYEESPDCAIDNSIVGVVIFGFVRPCLKHS